MSHLTPAFFFLGTLVALLEGWESSSTPQTSMSSSILKIYVEIIIFVEFGASPCRFP
jgi:hypothetical protein